MALLSRRTFLLTALAAAVGDLAAYGTEALHDFSLNEGANADVALALKALGVDRLKSDASSIFDVFLSSQLGGLSIQFQLFWRLHQIEGGIDALEHELAKRETALRDNNHRHRAAMVPYVARIHALLDQADGGQASDLESEVVDYLRALSDPTVRYDRFGFSRRKGLELLWQNTTAALLRSRVSFAHFRGAELAQEAFNLCTLFLHGQHPELLFPAVSAFQFLHSYATSLRITGVNNIDVAELVARILEQEAQVSGYWFSELAQILSWRQNYETMYPQVNEMLVGNRDRDRAFVRYATMMRIESGYRSRTRAEAKASPFVASGDGSGTRSPGVFENYSIHLRDLSPVSGDDTRRGLTSSALSNYLDNEQRASLSAEAPEKPSAHLIQSMVPFRQFDGYRRIEQHVWSDNAEHPAVALLSSLGVRRINDDRLRSIVLDLSRQQAAELDLVCNFAPDPVVLEERVEDQVTAGLTNVPEHIAELFDEASSVMRNRTSVVRSFGFPTGTATSPIPKEGDVAKDKDEYWDPTPAEEAAMKRRKEMLDAAANALSTPDPRTPEEKQAERTKLREDWLSRNNIVFESD